MVVRFRPQKSHVLSRIRSHDFLRPNETEISHRQGVVTSMLDLQRNGPVGFIVWLDPLSAGHKSNNLPASNGDHDENRRHNCRHADGPDRRFQSIIATRP